MHESPRSTVVIWVIAAGLAVLAGARLLGGGDASTPPVRVDRGPDGPSAARASQTADTDLWVHVAGAVKKPGVMRLPSGSRVATAVMRAGGPTQRADLTLVNLAAQVQDGQQIVVPVMGAGPAAGAGAGTAGVGDVGAGGSTPGVKLHLSTATAVQLDEIDGIGPTLAERIVEHRDAHGGFRSVQELGEVEGIGEKRLATLRDALQP
jgi:competence protein ComEA